MRQKVEIVKISKDNTSLWLSNLRTFIIESRYLKEVEQWREGDMISIKDLSEDLPSDSPYCYRLENNGVSVMAGISND